MEIFCKDYMISITEKNISELSPSSIFIVGKTGIDKNYKMEIYGNSFSLIDYDITKLSLILGNNFCIFINELDTYIISSTFVDHYKYDGYYLGHVFTNNYLYLILQTQIVRIKLTDLKHINSKLTNFIKEYNIDKQEITLHYDDSVEVLTLL